MDFYKKVEIVCRRIPYGKVATYGQIAMLCGRPRNMRQVGFALNKKISRDAPAHRVVSAKGTLSGAAAFDMPGQQKMMLEAEGVAVDQSLCVDLKKYGWKNSLEEALELQRIFAESAD